MRCLWFPWGTSYVTWEMHHNRLRLGTQSRKQTYFSVNIRPQSLPSFSCCHRFAFRMWDRTTYPLTLLMKMPVSYTEAGGKQVIILIVQNFTITIPKMWGSCCISLHKISGILPSDKPTSDTSKETVLWLWDVWKRVRLNTHRRPA